MPSSAHSSTHPHRQGPTPVGPIPSASARPHGPTPVGPIAAFPIFNPNLNIRPPTTLPSPPTNPNPHHNTYNPPFLQYSSLQQYSTHLYRPGATPVGPSAPLQLPRPISSSEAARLYGPTTVGPISSSAPGLQLPGFVSCSYSNRPQGPKRVGPIPSTTSAPPWGPTPAGPIPSSYSVQNQNRAHGPSQLGPIPSTPAHDVALVGPMSSTTARPDVPSPVGPTSGRPHGRSLVGPTSSSLAIIQKAQNPMPPSTNPNPSLCRRRDWSSLPELAVITIANHLDTVQFLCLAGVCKSWRTICTQSKAQIVAHHQPLLLRLQLFAMAAPRPFCELYSFADKKLYSKPLPPSFRVPGFESQLGCYHGYVLLYSSLLYGRNTIYMANPFTEDLVETPSLPSLGVRTALLTAPPAEADSVVVAFTEDHMMVCRPGIDDCWSDVHLSAFMQAQDIFGGYYIEQAVFFKGRVYIATHDSVVTVEVEFGEEDDEEVYGNQLDPFRVVWRPWPGVNDHCPLLLFVEKEELFVGEVALEFFPYGSKMKRMYRLQDREKGSWEEVKSLGGVTVFAAHNSQFLTSRRVRGLAQWGSKDWVLFIDFFSYLPSYVRSPTIPYWVSPREIIRITSS